MQQPKKYIGVVQNLHQPEGNDYYIGKVQSCSLELSKDNIFFDQKFSVSKKNDIDIEYLNDNPFIEFEIHRTDKNGKIQVNPKNCKHLKEEIILLRYIEFTKDDLTEISFIISNANLKLQEKIKGKIETQYKNTQVPEIKTRIEKLCASLPAVFNSVKIDEKTTPILEQDNKPKSFLETIFAANTLEYNQNLFNVLVAGFTTIENDEIYQQAKFLINFNASLEKPTFYLNFSFYHKANDEFKFKFWFDGLIDFCAIQILKNVFEKADNSLKIEIIRKCQGDANGFLLLKNFDVEFNAAKEELQNTFTTEKEELNKQLAGLTTKTEELSRQLIEQTFVKNPNEIEEVYFSNIRQNLLQKLKEAKQTICVAVAWFTNDELFNMLCNKLQEGVKVELIIINDYINNWEGGLPFQSFIDKGGKLYLSEYPNIMHHKFCLIDNNTLFNGSYNWTYYAENRNDENVMLFKEKPDLIEKFQSEFERIKTKIGKKTTTFEPFDNSQMLKFERVAFREYFSTDLTLRAQAFQKTEAWRLNLLINTALTVDEKNQNAKQLQDYAINETIIKNQAIDDAIKQKQIEITKIQNTQEKNFSPTKIIGEDKQLRIQQLENEKKILECAKNTTLQGKRGSLRINLLWQSFDDLDLHVYDPDNNQIFYRNKNAICQNSMGLLDIDANAGSGTTKTPQENIFWDKEAPQGEYKVEVHYYAYREQEKCSFTVTIMPEFGKPIIFASQIKLKEIISVSTFSYNNGQIKEKD